MDAVERKKQLRRIVAARRKEYEESELFAMSMLIMERILELEEYRNAKTVFAYMDLPGEVQTRALIQKCLKDKKRVAVPKIMIPEKGTSREAENQAVEKGTSREAENLMAGKRTFLKEMRFYEIRDFDHMVRNTMHIPEPDPAFCPYVDDEEDAFVIMPGVAFDRNRNRIGYGGGYYDRYLSVHRNHFTVGAAYDFQIFDEVPHEDMDIRPRILVTPHACYRPR